MLRATQFAERQYETNFHLELGSGSGTPFVPTQPLEMYLGIDAVTDARDAHRIWRILNANIPRRINLSPFLWPRLPRRFFPDISGQLVSLFFQFKVPKYNDGKKAKYKLKFGSPYYEVAITKHQQKELEDLQRRVQSRALVRYAAPAFWTRADFDRHATKRQILSMSAYIAPSRVASHKKWMYATPSGKAVLNPDPEEVESVGWEAITGLMREQAREESLRAHVAGLAASIRATTGETIEQKVPEWFIDMEKYIGPSIERLRASPEDVRYLSDLRTVVDAAEQADTTWQVMLLPDSNTSALLRMMEREGEWYWRHRWY
ncbi:MAG: hypothetical protein JNG88_06255 [Phycisphaerales bacterium]|nr:hypothetical protein [Phycisphaerales bacterium]